MSLRVGLTGGMGSGKSTVARILELQGIPVYYADDAAKRIMNEDKNLRTAIQKQFGEQAYKQGALDRGYIATRVFNDPYQLELLNALVHPATILDAAEWMARQTAPYSVKEAALIFESGSAEHLDYVIGVYAPSAVRISRIIARDHVKREHVIKRMSTQVDEDIKMKLCDYVIVNDEQQLLIPQVLKIHEHLTSLATAKQ